MSRATTSTDETTHGTPPSTWWDTAALGLLALLVAGPGLGSPAAFVFDEIYYVSDAYSHLEVGVGRGFQAHPPLGTWLVAAGIAVSNSPVGWRLASLVLGVVSVVALHRLAGGLLGASCRSRLLALVPPLLLISDGSWLVLSRTAMLDGPLTALVLLATTFSAMAWRPGRDLDWKHVSLAGVSAGAALAVKWSGVLALPLMAVAFFATQERGRLTDRIRRAALPLAATGILAALVYALSWLPFAVQRDTVTVLGCPDVAAPCVQNGGLIGVVAQHDMLVRYHTRIQSDAEIASPPSLWPLLRDPIGFYRPDCHTQSEPLDVPTLSDEFATCDEELPEDSDTVAYRGNVVVWFSFVGLLPILLAAVRHGEIVARLALAGWALQWIPWLLATRVSYLWYMAPTVPFISLGLAAVAVKMPRSRITRVYIGATLGALIGLVFVATTRIPEAAVLVGWAAGGGAAAGPQGDHDAEISRASVVIATVMTLAAGTVAVVTHSSWTAG